MLPNEILKMIADVDLDSCRGIGYLGKEWEDYYNEQRKEFSLNYGYRGTYQDSDFSHFEPFLKHCMVWDEEANNEFYFSYLFYRGVEWVKMIHKYVPHYFQKFSAYYTALLCESGEREYVRWMRQINFKPSFETTRLINILYNKDCCYILKFCLEHDERISAPIVTSLVENFSFPYFDGGNGIYYRTFITQRKIIQILSICLRHGYDINTKFDTKDKTLLHFAVEYGLERVVAFLIDKGCDTNARIKRNKNNTAILMARKIYKQALKANNHTKISKYKEIIRLLSQP